MNRFFFLLFTDNYRAFDEDRKWVDAPNQFIINTQPVIVQIGVTPTVDTTVIMGTLAQWKQASFRGGFQDTLLQMGFLIQTQTLYVLKAKFTVYGRNAPNFVSGTFSWRWEFP